MKKRNSIEYGLDWTDLREGITLNGYASAILPNLKRRGLSEDLLPHNLNAENVAPFSPYAGFTKLHQ